MRIGVEVGGTFTDLVLFDGNEVRVTKVPSTPAEPDRGAMNALRGAAVDLSDVDDLVHGSTVATNAILERKGARVCLFVTEGTRDILHIQRHDRRRIYDLYYQKPEPVVARRDIFGVPERVDASGTVILRLDPTVAEDAVRKALSAADYDSAAVCFLNSYANPEHENAVAEIIKSLFPEIAVTCSVDVCREFREYERCSTTALAAYVQPVIEGYLQRFDAALRASGYKGRFSIMQSNGGRLPASAMGENAITSLFSGPAAGVTGATHQARRSGFEDIITLDMGGTSTDVCLVEAGKPLLCGNTEIDGLPIKTPVIDIATVGAGGGSIVWIDNGGLLRVGPRSAGATPGPACYGRGGIDATITDAHLIRGTVRRESFLGGTMSIDADAARGALRPIADQLGISIEEAADSAVRVAESNIVRAIQRISTEKGKDPRDYALVAFGGAGPMQAARVAEELGVATVVIPPHAGVLSAYGLLASDFIHYATRTHRLRVQPENIPLFRTTLHELADSVASYLAGLGLETKPTYTITLEMRYVTQAFEIPVGISFDQIDTLDAEALAERFDAAHREVFEFDEGGHQACEIVSFRVGGAVTPPGQPMLVDDVAPAAPSRLTIYEQGQTQACVGLARSGLAQSGAALPGPALVEDGTSTLYVPAPWVAEVDSAHNVILTVQSPHGDLATASRLDDL